ncbi:leukemia inhibitory factor-like [Trichechus inunguis]
MNRPCSSNLMTQVKNQLEQLNSSANPLFVAYYTAQGEPFTKYVDRLCRKDLMSFPPFHANSTEKDKLVELYRVMAYFHLSLHDVMKCQKTLNPKDQNLHSKLNSTADTFRGVLSNVLCRLCDNYNVRLTDMINGLNTSEEDVFQKKRLGCQLLFKYKQVIAELAQAFYAQDLKVCCGSRDLGSRI